MTNSEKVTTELKKPSPSCSLTSSQLDTAIALVRRQSPTVGIWDMLLKALHVEPATLANGLRDWHGVDFLERSDETSVFVLSRLNAQGEKAKDHLWIRYKDRFVLVCEDPWTAQAANEILTHQNALLVLAQENQLQRLQVNAVSSPEPVRINTLSSDNNSKLEESSVVRFVDDAIKKAYREGASDIHFETDRGGIQLKFRLDGVIARGDRYADAVRAEEIISRIKVMAQLDITERRRPQDGRIHWTNSDQLALDLRVSIMPSIFGEDAVLRLLDKAQLRSADDQKQPMSLEILGFDSTTANSIRKCASRPHGMLLVTGPTGSGKTTTIYAALSEVNDGFEKIITIEDPVEYELAGVLQIPVNEQKGLTFATGLRSILRHDPDKILVGEIRDAETAEIAVQSSLTGHLVFTTVHANSMFDVLGRFQHFGIDPFAFASALNAVVVQRLLRRICDQCARQRTIEPDLKAKLNLLGVDLGATVPIAIGCAHCRNTGYRGRFVVAEVHEITNELRDLIISKRSMSELMATVYRDPSLLLLVQAFDRIRAGVTTIEEVSRVIGLD